MAPKFKIIKQIECSVCHGAGKFEHPDGDVEWCTFCGKRGYWESEVGIEEAADDAGYVLATPTQPDSEQMKLADVALQNARFVLENGRLPETVSAHALLAVAEQLALLNETLAKIGR